jgi:hypothetical protein
MKMFLLLALFVLPLGAGACDWPQAQFIGRVKKHSITQRSESIVECGYQIEFLRFDSSEVCPLVIGEVTGYEFTDPSCTMTNGQPISGMLTRRGEFIVPEEL